jgi:cell division protein FtsB
MTSLDLRWQQWWPRVQPLLLPLAAVLVMLYTADQLLTGERGLVTWRVMREQVQELKTDVAELEAANARLLARIGVLKLPAAQGREAAARQDLEDELIRRELGFVQAGERVILR